MKVSTAIFKTFFLCLAIIAQINFCYAQSSTVGILPNAKTTFVDQNGKPLTGGSVNFYIPGTTTPKATWQDSGATITNTNPVKLDAAGRALIWGNGSYRQVVKDKNGNLIWDQVTSTNGSGTGGGTATVGDGSPVGSIRLFAGFVAPAQYAFAYGQEFARLSFPQLFQAITNTQAATCTSGSPTLSGISDTSQLPIGSPIESTCLNAGATISSKTVNSITASSNAIISTTSTVTTFPFGNGDGSTTFNIPDLRGRIIAGRDNMGGIAANRLTATGLGVSAAANGSVGGTETKTLATNNLPPYTPAGAVTSILSGASASFSGILGFQGSASGGNFAAASNGGSAITALPVTGTVTSSFAGTAQGGTSTPFSAVQPTLVTNYIIKTTPDSNPNTFFGVASVGGMQGIINCGTGISCSGNTITATGGGGGGGAVPAPTPTVLGGVFSSSAPANQFANGIDNTGAVTYSQPSFTNLSGTASNAQLATMPTLTIKSNITGGTASPSDNSMSAILDAALGNTQGSIIYRGVSSYAVLTPGTTGQCLITAGAGGNPSWGTCGGGGGSIPTAAASLNGNATNASAGTTSNFALSTLTAKSVLDTVNDQLVILDNSTTTLKKATPGAVVTSYPTSAASFLGNPGGTSGTTSNFTIGGLSNRVSVDTTNDKIPILNNSTGALNYVTPSQLGGGGGGAVSSVGGLTGAVGVANGIGVSGSNIQTTFTQNGTGAVAQTIPSKILKNCVTPWDFTSSTIDNGSTDAKAAIQAALNTGKCVYLPTPATCYLVNSDLTMGASQVIYGDGIGVKTLCVTSNAGFTNGLFNCNTAQPGNQFKDMRIVYTQPSPSGSFTLSIPNGSNVGTVSSFAGSVPLAANQYISDYNGNGLSDGLSQGVFITSLGTSTGGNGTINLSQTNNFGHTVTRTMSTPDNLRPQLTQYSPTFKCQNSPRVVLQNIQVENAWVMGDFQNNAGGFYADHINASAYAAGFMFDGSVDTVRVNNFHFWPFGVPNNAALYVFEQTAKNRIAVTDFPVGLYLGRVDGFFASEFFSIAYQAAYVFHGTIFTPGDCYCNITNSGFDSFNGITQNSGIMNLSNSYFSLYQGPYSAYIMAGTGTQANLSNIFVTNQSYSSAFFMQSCTTCTFEIQNVSFNNGGNMPNMFGIDGSATTYSTFKVLGGYADSVPTGATIITALSPSSGANNLKFSNFNATTTANVAYSNPLMDVRTGWRYSITNNSVNDKGTGAGTFFSNTADCYCVFTGNIAPGWTVSVPTPGSGYYTGNPH